MSWMDDLSAALPPPDGMRKVAASADWQVVEERLGTAFPPDYKDFIARWGDGTWEGFIMFYPPETPERGFGLPGEAVAFARAYETLKSRNPDRYALPLAPAVGALLPFARTENGDYCGWIIGDGPPESWSVAVLGHGDGMPETTDMSFAEFLTRLSRDEYRPARFPGDLWDETPGFLPAKRA